jgi:hypothetical protein
MSDFTALSRPFAAGDIEWRVQSSGEKNNRIWARVLAYVTNRAIMHRLDEVVGPAGWRNEYAAAPCGGVMCGLSIKVDGEWVTKWDGAENTDIEGVKGGLSGAMKRAAVQWGIGRYLYDLDAGYATIHEGGKHSDKLKSGTWFNWDPPALPAWALPAPDQKPENEPASLETRQQITVLMHGRVIQPREREALDKRLANGLTQGKAAEAVTWLESLPEREDLATIKKRYFAMLNEAGGVDGVIRHEWQRRTTGKFSTKLWDVTDFQTAINAIEAGNGPSPLTLTGKAGK